MHQEDLISDVIPGHHNIVFKNMDLFEARPDLGESGLSWPHIFVHPLWLKTWRDVFGKELQICLGLVEKDKQPIGLAPLSVSGDIASFIGDPDICDYLDFWTIPGRETDFYESLLENLRGRGINGLDLRHLRPESTVLSHLTVAAKKAGGTVILEPDGASWDMKIPGDWDSYLASLSGKQRHEIRRKTRRLNEAGTVEFSRLKAVEDVDGAFEIFLSLFKDSRGDKELFMTSDMELFFRSMFRIMAGEDLLRVFILSLDGRAAAAAICFDYGGGLYLYNCGYDPEYGALSVGFLCKVMSIKYGVENGRVKYDFLNGAEPYKKRLGGREVALTRCAVTF